MVIRPPRQAIHNKESAVLVDFIRGFGHQELESLMAKLYRYQRRIRSESG